MFFFVCLFFNVAVKHQFAMTSFILKKSRDNDNKIYRMTRVHTTVLLPLLFFFFPYMYVTIILGVLIVNNKIQKARII